MAQAMRTMERRSRRRQIGGGLLAASLLLVAASDVAGQAMCGPRDQLVRHLSTSFGEIPTGSGLMGNGALLETLTSPSGTWSILVTKPGGASCLVASGEGWIQAPVPLPGRDS